jgi:hypothetical protein
MEFKIWLRNVEIIVNKKLKLKLCDLPDEDYWINWNNKLSYEKMADIIIKDQNKFLQFILE